MAYEIPIILLFAATMGAFLLLALTTFSMPLSSLYFLYSSQAGGVRFGLWGWCIDEDGTCLGPLELGYTWEPQITARITSALVFYPISAILALLSLISFIPVSYHRSSRNEKVSFLFVLSSLLSSFLAFVFMIGISNVAKKRFKKRGFDASFGPLIWLSLVATLILLVVTLACWHATTKTLQAQRPSDRETTPTRRRHHQGSPKVRRCRDVA
ncbi:hypothetical protein BDZ94DRAFT_186544 [Collybia nuda]|uniref:Uncharacterized protein n=1 Tax=Collybia nuda TaxID=64659 RepID=A0A9P6CN62_9AGAR|nr:hypothetical protein BDZ94DRAFT_186544 [Collybia nuda]